MRLNLYLEDTAIESRASEQSQRKTSAGNRIWMPRKGIGEDCRLVLLARSKDLEVNDEV